MSHLDDMHALLLRHDQPVPGVERTIHAWTPAATPRMTCVHRQVRITLGGQPPSRTKG